MSLADVTSSSSDISLREWIRFHPKWILRVLSVTVVLLVWQVWASQPSVLLFAPPTAIVSELINQVFIDKTLLYAVLEALQQAVLGYVIAASIGVPLGFLIGFWQPAHDFLNPLLDALYVTPMVALVPLIIIWFGLSIWAKVFLVVIFTIFVITINTEAGVTETPQGLVDAARVFGASDREIYYRVHFRHAIPYILTGLRLGAGRAVRAMVVAELFISAGALGKYLVQSGVQFQVAKLIAGIVFLSLVGVVAVQAVRMVEERLLVYR